MSDSSAKEIQLLQVAGVWTLYYKGRRYVRLPDAESREDAEQQISQMARNAKLKAIWFRLGSIYSQDPKN
jgi:hypothetical protein